MEGDEILFIGEVLGNYTFPTVSGSSITIPCLSVHAETLKVICTG